MTGLFGGTDGSSTIVASVEGLSISTSPSASLGVVDSISNSNFFLLPLPIRFAPLGFLTFSTVGVPVPLPSPSLPGRFIPRVCSMARICLTVFLLRECLALITA